MTSHTLDKKLLKKIIKQINGKITDEHSELIPHMIIGGKDYIGCYDITQKRIIMIRRGIICYVLDEKKDELDRIMVYTINGDVILIEESEIIHMGYN
jgi:metal-responsive CopG/Arc/MetJ family transcriptional regulator